MTSGIMNAELHEACSLSKQGGAKVVELPYRREDVGSVSLVALDSVRQFYVSPPVIFDESFIS